MREPRVINHGVDTFIVNAYYTKHDAPIKKDLDETLASLLDLWKQQAQLESQPFETPWSFNDRILFMHPNGAMHGQYPWMLKTKDITLYISTGKWNGIASVRFSSAYLWGCTSFTESLFQVKSLLETIFHEPMHLQPSEVHLCTDVANWQDIASMDRKENFVSRSRKRGKYHEGDATLADMRLNDFSDGLHETGFDFSKRGAMSCTIYDKTRELLKSGKLWLYDLWQLLSEWDPEEESSVWRVEMKFKREALHQLKQGEMFHGIEDAFELEKRFPLMWAYATGHVGGGDDGLPDGWLRCVIPTDDTNRARWPTHPVWTLVQDAFRDPIKPREHFGKIIRKRHDERSIEKALEALLGYSTSVSAWKGGKLAQPETDLSVYMHWLSINLQDVLNKKGKVFSEEVQRKLKQK